MRRAERLAREEIDGWLNGITETVPWRQRRQMRQTLTDEVCDAMHYLGEEHALRNIDRLWTHPYFSFEPRDDDPGLDEQTGFVESGKYMTVAVGGNGSGKTFCGAQKLVEFIAANEPPVHDCPIWIIAETLEMASDTCWAQKLFEILPAEWVDWDRIVWYREKLNQPSVVPLRPWANHSHPRPNAQCWKLEFKSYEQGRAKFQGTSIAAAWFTEQFPWSILEEVMRGLREYGRQMWAEFTPVDPAKSAEMEEAYYNWVEDRPEYKNWSFHKLNTTSAFEAGHVTEDWYHTFCSTISDEMADTRLAGAFASYEGAIYQTYDKRVHVVSDGFGEIPAGCIHKRGVDWGASEENALVVLWGAKDTLGCWWIYDEYYSTDQRLIFPEHVELIKAQQPWDTTSLHYQETYVPPDRPDLARMFNRAGIPTARAYVNVYDGIEYVRQALKINKMIGEPRIFIDGKRCPHLVRQLATYRWKRSSGQGVNPADAKPEPLKKDDHAPDALRYLIATDARAGLGIRGTTKRVKWQNRPGLPHDDRRG